MRRFGGLRFLAGAALLGLGGCHSCEDHPYVPYAISDGAPAIGSVEAGSVNDSGAPTSLAGNGDAGALTAPPGATKWDVFGVTLTAPEDHVFAFAAKMGTVSDVDILAIVAPKNAPGPLDAIAYRIGVKQADPPTALFSTKDEVSDASCAPNARFDDAGSGALSVLLSFTCAGHGAPPARMIALVAQLQPGLIGRFAAKIRDAENDPPLDARVEYSDVDHDGVPDVTLTTTIDDASAKFVFADRPAGLSRQAGEPEASFLMLSRAASARLDKKDAKGAIAATKNLRALHRALCQQSPRLTPVLGVSSLACVPSTAMKKATLTNARALAMSGERLRALFELDVAARLGEKVDLKNLAPYVDTISIREKKVFDDVLGKPTGGAPSFAPLLFDSQDLFLRLADGQPKRAEPLATTPSAPAPSTWPLAIASADGQSKLIAAYDPCDDANVRLTLAGATSMDDVVLPIEPLMGRKCEDTKGVPVSVAPIAWTQDGLSLFVLGQYVHIAPNNAPTVALRPKDLLGAPGGAASGSYAIVKTPLGIAIDDGKKAHVLRDVDGSALDGNRCVVTQNGTKAACVASDKAVLYSL